MVSLTDLLLEPLKDYLQITWDDPKTDSKLIRLLKSGRAYLDHKVFGDSDKKLDFEKDEMAKQLLFDYVRYAYNNVFELFESNFGHEIFNLQLREGVKDFEDTDTETSS